MPQKKQIFLALCTLLAAVPHLDAMENEAPQNPRKRPSRWDQEIPVSTILANQKQLSQEPDKTHADNQQETRKTAEQDVTVRNHTKKKSRINYQDVKGRTALHMNARKASAGAIGQLLTAGASIYLTDNVKRTPLMYAASNGNTAAIQRLLQSIPDQTMRTFYINKKDIQYKTALDWAAFGGKESAIDVLIAAGVDTALTDRKGKNSLHWAAYNGHTAAVARLIANNVYDTPDREGRTALHWAAAHGYPEIASLLLAAVQNDQKLAYLNHQDNEGQTPLFLAARYEHAPVITVLRKHGAANVPNFYGETAIEAAAKRNKKIALETLMQTGLQDIPDGMGRTAMSYAAEAGLLQAVRILLECGAHDIPDYQGKTGLTWALENNQCGTTHALSEYWQKAAPLILQQAGIDRDALQQSAEEEASVTIKKRHIQDSEEFTNGEIV